MLIIDRRHRYYYYTILIFLCLYFLFLVNYNFSKNLSNEYLLENDSLFEEVLLNQPVYDCTGDPLKKWCENQVHLCNSSLIIFNKLFAKTDSIILQTKLAKGTRQGGEDLHNVLNQTENDEYFHFEKGFIQVIS